jgi:hypothetical protein
MIRRSETHGPQKIGEMNERGVKAEGQVGAAVGWPRSVDLPTEERLTQAQLSSRLHACGATSHLTGEMHGALRGEVALAVHEPSKYTEIPSIQGRLQSNLVELAQMVELARNLELELTRAAHLHDGLLDPDRAVLVTQCHSRRETAHVGNRAAEVLGQPARAGSADLRCDLDTTKLDQVPDRALCPGPDPLRIP